MVHVESTNRQEGEIRRQSLWCVDKALGRRWPGDLTLRGQCNLEHRISLSWMKFQNLSQVLTNQNVPVHLRLRLFDSIVSPTLMYSLATSPLTSGQLERLDATQRRMLRRIVGWVRLEDEAWERTGSRMKQRLQAALNKCPVKPWSEARRKHQELGE